MGLGWVGLGCYLTISIAPQLITQQRDKYYLHCKSIQNNPLAALAIGSARKQKQRILLLLFVKLVGQYQSRHFNMSMLFFGICKLHWNQFRFMLLAAAILLPPIACFANRRSNMTDVHKEHKIFERVAAA